MKVISDIAALNAAITEAVWLNRGQKEMICRIINGYVVTADLVKREDVLKEVERIDGPLFIEDIEELPAWDGK